MNFEIDHSLTTFTSEGNINQCENALNAALNGVLSAGAQSKDGVVLTSLKNLPPLVEKNKVFKVSAVCDTIGMTYAGLHPDYRIIYDKACELAESYKEVYGRYPYVDVFVCNLSRIIQEYTQKGGYRPFGVLVLIAGFVEEKRKCRESDDESDMSDDGGSEYEIVPILYQMEPSGSFQECRVSAVGKEYSGAMKYVENRREKLDDNVVSCVCALREFAGYGIGSDDVDLGVLRADSRTFKVYSRREVKEVFDSMSIK